MSHNLTRLYPLLAALLGLGTSCRQAGEPQASERAKPVAAACTPAPGSLLPGGPARWKPVWSEEFEGTDADLDKNWQSQNSASSHILCGRYRENAVVTNGLLRLVNRKESRDGKEWTSGNVWTKKTFQYGYFECRYRYAAAEGTNNSFWLMPAGKPSGPDAKHFEIDINEGHYPNQVNSNIHNHTDRIVVNGKTTHPTSSRSFTFGTRPDITLTLENPVSTRRLRIRSRFDGALHLGEVRVYGVNPAGYPDPLSATADQDRPGLVNHARAAGTTITASGFIKAGEDTTGKLADGNPDTRWTSQRDGEKWVEFTFPAELEIGCVQFLDGYLSGGQWKNLMNDYRVEWHDGARWMEMASFDVARGEHNFGREFHVHGLEWTEKELVFYLDGRELRREKNEFCHGPAPVWLSLAIIAWAGPITDAINGTAMEVDYVRMYERK